MTAAAFLWASVGLTLLVTAILVLASAAAMRRAESETPRDLGE